MFQQHFVAFGERLTKGSEKLATPLPSQLTDAPGDSAAAPLWVWLGGGGDDPWAKPTKTFGRGKIPQMVEPI